MPHIALHVLGTERLVCSGRVVAPVPGIFWSVVGCLLAARRRSMSRTRMAAKLWPDRDEDAARHCLASALWRMRARIGPLGLPIASDADTVSLAAEAAVWIDARAFEQRAQAALERPSLLASARERSRLARALRLYRGDLLGETDQADIAIERARLQALQLDALYELSKAQADAGDWPGAVRSARELCALEPLREDAQRLLIEALDRCGNRGLALRQFELCAAVLARDLQVRPMSETLALRARLIGGQAAAADERNVYRASLLRTRDSLVETLSVLDRALRAS